MGLKEVFWVLERAKTRFEKIFKKFGRDGWFLGDKRRREQDRLRGEEEENEGN